MIYGHNYTSCLSVGRPLTVPLYIALWPDTATGLGSLTLTHNFNKNTWKLYFCFKNWCYNFPWEYNVIDLYAIKHFLSSTGNQSCISADAALLHVKKSYMVVVILHTLLVGIMLKLSIAQPAIDCYRWIVSWLCCCLTFSAHPHSYLRSPPNNATLPYVFCCVQLCVWGKWRSQVSESGLCLWESYVTS